MIRARSIALAALLASTSLAHAGRAPKQKTGKVAASARTSKSTAQKSDGSKLAGKRTASEERTITPQQEAALTKPEAAEAAAPAATAKVVAPEVAAEPVTEHIVDHAAAAKSPSLAMRLARGTVRGIGVAGKAVGSFVASQFEMRSEMKDTLALSKALRKDGQLTASAEVLRDAPRAQGLWEGFRAWNTKRTLLKAARRQLKAKSIDSDPIDGHGATATLVAADMTSPLARFLANRALHKGLKNAVRTARKLGDRGRFDEALEMLEWSATERPVDAKAAGVLDRLYGQAMMVSDRASMRFTKARSAEGQQATFNETLEAMDMASRFSDMLKHATGHSSFDVDRAGLIVRRTGLSQEAFSAAMDEMRGVTPEPVAATPTARPAGSSLD